MIILLSYFDDVLHNRVNKIVAFYIAGDTEWFDNLNPLSGYYADGQKCPSMHFVFQKKKKNSNNTLAMLNAHPYFLNKPLLIFTFLLFTTRGYTQFPFPYSPLRNVIISIKENYFFNLILSCFIWFHFILFYSI